MIVTKTYRIYVLGAFVLGNLLIPCTTYAVTPWQSDVGVTIAASKDTTARTITYTVTVTNNGDDDAREAGVVIHIGSLSVNRKTNSAAYACTTQSISNLNYVKCTRATNMTVRESAKFTVVANNPTNGPHEANAQAWSISPDQTPANNSATSVVK